MIYKGRAWKFGDNIDTDVIIPVQYCTSVEPKELGNHCMAGISLDFPSKIDSGDIIVAGKNFGCGSSREPAPIAIKAAGISCVIAESFARIFYRNAFNVGLPLLECPEAHESIEEGNELEVNLNRGIIKNYSNNKVLIVKPIPQFMQELINDGGLLKHIVKQLDMDNHLLKHVS